MARGGKRIGAGRPKGSTTGKAKKTFSFRLSEEELQAVKKVLAEMRKKLTILLLMLMFVLPVNALTLEGGVTYTEETARAAAFDGLHKYYGYSNIKSYNRSLFLFSINNDDVERIIEYKTKYIGFPINLKGIIFKNEPNTIYVYKKQKDGYLGVCIIAYDNIGNNTTRSANYETRTGKLISVGIVTEGEEYKYDMNGKLLGHWKNGELKSADRKVRAEISSILYNSP